MTSSDTGLQAISEIINKASYGESCIDRKTTSTFLGLLVHKSVAPTQACHGKELREMRNMKLETTAGKTRDAKLGDITA